VIFEATPIPGAFIVRPERRQDDRGFFARVWCRDEFAARGIDVDMVQASVSHNRIAGTLRGLHFARAPAREGKLVRCEHGRVFDAIVDLRPDSPAFLRHFAMELDDTDRAALYVPPGVGHGFQTLENDCDVLYMMTEAYQGEHADGVRWNDPAFGIPWPRAVTSIAERDRTYPDFDRAAHAARCATGATA
jgi:dTDP-4-dehydrorhamnose 3,5-epimerase